MMATHLFAVLLWCALAPLALLWQAPLQDVSCGKGDVPSVVTAAVQHLNEQHKHGFKFKLHKILGSNIQQVLGGCHVDVALKLMQTKCHFTNPKPHQQCVTFRMDERGAVATCNVKLEVMYGMAKVIKHFCATRPEHTNAEMAWICPDCPMLLPLEEPLGVKAANQAVLKFNREGKHQNYFTLMEVAQLTAGYIANIGMLTWLKLSLVETDCPREAKNTFAPCTPRCFDQASHIFCQATYYNWQDQIGDLSCELYQPQNSVSHAAGAPNFMCQLLFHQSAEAFACKAQLGIRKPAIHHICPFPLIVHQPYWLTG